MIPPGKRELLSYMLLSAADTLHAGGLNQAQRNSSVYLPLNFLLKATRGPSIVQTVLILIYGLENFVVLFLYFVFQRRKKIDVQHELEKTKSEKRR